MKQLKVLSLVLLLSLSSCVSTSINSSKALEHNEKLDNVFVLIKGAEFITEFHKPFFSKMHTTLKEKGINSWSYYIDPISIESQADITERIDAVNPNLLMVIEPKDIRHIPFGLGWDDDIMDSGVTFDIKLMKYKSQTLLWRASLDAESTHGISLSAKKASKRVIKQLAADGLL